MKYSFESRVRYSELGKDGRMALYAMVNYLQDCSTFQSEAVGKGIGYLREQGKAWLLSSWQIQIDRYPEIDEKIKISTWSYGCKSMYGYRNFAIKDSENHYLLKANSVWVLYDVNRKRPIRVTEEDLRGYEAEEKLDMIYSERKLRMPEQREKRKPVPVTRCQIDTNGHVNNGQYIRVASEYLPEGFEVGGLCAEYRRAALYGDTFYPETAGTENGCAVALNDEMGKPYAVIVFQEAHGRGMGQ